MFFFAKGFAMSVVLESAVLDSVRSKFDFTVDKFPLSGPDSLRTPLYGLFRSAISKMVTTCPLPRTKIRGEPSTEPLITSSRVSL